MYILRKYVCYFYTKYMTSIQVYTNCVNLCATFTQNVWEKLENLKMLSIQRRLQRYRVIYTWRVIEGLSPACGLVVTHGPETRLGRRCSADERGRSSIFNQTFQVQGSKLFNSIPKNIRNLTGCRQEEFKEQLDIYLGTLQDQPASPGWIPQGVSEAGTPSNSILHQKERLDRVNETRRRPRGM